LFQQPRIADGDLVVVDAAADALAGNGFESGSIGEPEREGVVRCEPES